jgi:hypothetical protein
MKIPHEKGVANHSAPNFARYAARHAVKRKTGEEAGGEIELRKQTDQDADAVIRCGRPRGRER